MAWNTAEDVKAALADTWMLDYIKDNAVPESLAACWSDEGWYSIFYMFAQSEFSTENIDFLRCVEAFESSGDVAYARQVFDQFVTPGSPQQININSTNVNDLTDIFGEGGTGSGPPNMFDGAKAEIWSVTQADTFNQRFRAKAKMTQDSLWAGQEWDNVETRERS